MCYGMWCYVFWQNFTLVSLKTSTKLCLTIQHQNPEDSILLCMESAHWTYAYSKTTWIFMAFCHTPISVFESFILKCNVLLLPPSASLILAILLCHTVWKHHTSDHFKHQLTGWVVEKTLLCFPQSYWAQAVLTC